MRHLLTIEQAVARDQRLARAMEQLAEMRGNVGICMGYGTPVAADYPPEYDSWCEARRRAWAVANPVQYAAPGNPDDLARTIERAHSNWKKSKEQ